jgi:DNA-binding CsgD family transcriptional regulator
VLPGKQALTKLIGSVYDAAAEPTVWEPFLEQLTKISRADSAALVMHNLGLAVHTITASWETDADADRLYQQHYGSVDVWTMKAQSKPAGYVCTSDSLCPPEELATTEFYNDFLSRYGIAHGMFGMFGMVEGDTTSLASISLYRGPRSGKFRISDLGILNLLIPHIRRAFKLHFQFSQLKGRSEGIEAALNMLVTGVIFLGAESEVLLMNRKAEKLLGSKDGLISVWGKLSAAVRAESARLQALIHGAVQTGRGSGLSAGGTILISRENRRPLSITVAPLREINTSLSQRPAAVLFVSDPDRNSELPCDLLRSCYGLTPAEGRLAMVLMDGHSLKEAADSCGVTYNTAKSQLKIIFSKTHVQRQSELIRLLLNTGGVERSQETPGPSRTASW